MKEFRAFILRGNVVDLAVGVVIGAAFGTVVTSFVKDILTPITGIFGNFKEFDRLIWHIGGRATLRYGTFLNNILSFLLISASVFFMVVKPVNKLMSLRKTEPDVESPKRDCPHCLSSIPAAATRCAFCTQEVAA
jgi:large conductance mechanosensitive channel